MASDEIRTITSIFWNVGESIAEALGRFLGALQEQHYKNDKNVKKALSGYQGIVFYDEKSFHLFNKAKNEDYALERIAIPTEDVKAFMKICKEMGVDVLYTEKPKDLDRIIEKYRNGETLSSIENDYLNLFTRKEDGKIVENGRIAALSFNSKDIIKMEIAGYEFEKRMVSIHEKMKKAKIKNEKLKDQKNKIIDQVRSMFTEKKK